MTRCSSTIRLLEKARTRTLVFESSVLHVSHWWFCSWERKQRKHAIGKPLLDRERERERERGKTRFCDQSCRIDVNEKVDGTILKVILFGLTEDSILMNETSENTLNEGINRIFRVKIQFRENESRLSTTWRSKIWSEEIQNTHFRVTAWAWISKTTIVESQSMGRSSPAWENTLV